MRIWCFFMKNHVGLWQDFKRRKMSILENIRNRAGLLVTIIGIALLIFILQAALESGKWFANDQNVGEVAGKAISHQEFDAKVKQLIQNFKRQRQVNNIDAATEDMAVQETWNMMVNEIILTQEFAKLGIAVSDDELTDLMLVHPSPMVVQQFTDRETGRIAKDFADPATGQLDVRKLNAMVQQMSAEQEQAWSEIEKSVRSSRVAQKYATLVKKGLYVTSLQAKQTFGEQSKNQVVSYIGKKYSSIDDKAVQVTDADLQAYYNEHQNNYKQDIETRKIEYVSFDVVPSDDDIAAIKSDVGKLAEELKGKTSKEDSAFVVSEADSRTYDNSFHKKGTLSPIIDSLVFHADEGFVYGPFLENNAFKVAKLEKVAHFYDSVKVNHALIAFKGAERAAGNITRTREQAQHVADSLLKLVQTKKIKFEEANKLSDDLVSKNKGGEIGWLNPASGFAPAFKNSSLEHKKGDYFVVETAFGYHLIQVVDNSKNTEKYVQVAILDKKVEASAKTIQGYYVKANNFAGKYTTADLFDKGTEAEKLNRKIADNIKNGDKVIPGMESPRELVRWIYDDKRKIGDVSEPYELGGKFVVAKLAEIRPKGILKLALVKDEVEVKARERKKAEQIETELNKYLASNTPLENIAQQLGITVEKSSNLNFGTYALPGIGREDHLVGTTVALKKGAVSKPIIGRSGVYLVRVEDEIPVSTHQNPGIIQGQEISSLQARVDYEISEALRDASNVVDKKAKFY